MAMRNLPANCIYARPNHTEKSTGFLVTIVVLRVRIFPELVSANVGALPLSVVG
jgi:hypothetical protein